MSAAQPPQWPEGPLDPSGSPEAPENSATGFLLPLRAEDGDGRWGRYTFLKDATGARIASTSDEERREAIHQFVADINRFWTDTEANRVKAEIVDQLIVRGMDPETVVRRETELLDHLERLCRDTGWQSTVDLLARYGRTVDFPELL